MEVTRGGARSDDCGVASALVGPRCVSGAVGAPLFAVPKSARHELRWREQRVLIIAMISSADEVFECLSLFTWNGLQMWSSALSQHACAFLYVVNEETPVLVYSYYDYYTVQYNKTIMLVLNILYQIAEIYFVWPDMMNMFPCSCNA